MYYKAELEYLIQVLRKPHLHVALLDPASPSADDGVATDLGLRRILGLDENAGFLFRAATGLLRGNTIYRLTDAFRCCYLFLLLPGLPETQGLMVGPYTANEIDKAEVLEMAERFGLPASRTSLLSDCYTSIPLVRDQSTLITLLSTLGEVIWGSGDAFEIVDVEQEMTPRVSSSSMLTSDGVGEDPADIHYRMKVMEARYAFENELMDMVAQGRQHRAEVMLSGFSQFSFEQRTADPLRNLKNYMVVCNTLMRKAAERGGVHPVYLDSISSAFAKRIETMNHPDGGLELMKDMLRSYCRLVRRHAEVGFSTPVRSVLAHIETDLSGDLSLRTLAAAQNISAGYLSALFRKDTGKTLTEYVNEQRMEEAARLLGSTRLQVQTVAQHCGISDVNYFSKLFKKYYGLTPKKFRDEAAVRKT